MEDTHLANTVKMLNRNGKGEFSREPDPRFDALMVEVQKRKEQGRDILNPVKQNDFGRSAMENKERKKAYESSKDFDVPDPEFRGVLDGDTEVDFQNEYQQEPFKPDEQHQEETWKRTNKNQSDGSYPEIEPFYEKDSELMLSRKPDQELKAMLLGDVLNPHDDPFSKERDTCRALDCAGHSMPELLVFASILSRLREIQFTLSERCPDYGTDDRRKAWRVGHRTAFELATKEVLNELKDVHPKFKDVENLTLLEIMEHFEQGVMFGVWTSDGVKSWDDHKRELTESGELSGCD